MTRQLVVEIVGDASRFNRATSDAITQTEGLTGRLKGVGKGMVLGAGIASFNLLSSAIGIGIGKLGEAAQAYRDDQAGQALLAQALKNNIPGWNGNIAGAEAFAAAQGRLGFADDEVRASLGQLVGVTHDLGAAQDLTNIAMDVARAKGISLEQATDLLTKAHEGNGRALKGLGVDIGDATTPAEMLTAVMQNAGGAAETWAETNEGKLAVSNVKVGEAMEKVGGIVDSVSQAVVPFVADVLVGLVDVLGAVWDAIQPVVSTIVKALQPAFETVADVVTGLLPIFRTIFDGIATVIGGLVTVVGAEFEIISGVISGVIGGVKGAINLVIGLVNGVIDGINSFNIHVDIPNPFGGSIAKVDWEGLNLGKIAYLHSGGIVPGTPGSDVLSVLQAGERVLPAGQAAGPASVTIGTIVMNGVQTPREFLQELQREVSRQGMTLAPA